MGGRIPWDALLSWQYVDTMQGCEITIVHNLRKANPDARTFSGEPLFLPSATDKVLFGFNPAEKDLVKNLFQRYAGNKER